MTREEKVSSFVTPRNLEVHEHVSIFKLETNEMCENYAITIRIVVRGNSRAINLSRIYNFIAIISVRYSIVALIVFPSLLSGLFSSTREVVSTAHVPRTPKFLLRTELREIQR